LFQNSLKSEKSFGTYFRNLNLFRRFIGSEDFDSITRTKSEKLQIPNLIGKIKFYILTHEEMLI
jgi:hypothetical protein